MASVLSHLPKFHLRSTGSYISQLLLKFSSIFQLFKVHCSGAAVGTLSTGLKHSKSLLRIASWRSLELISGISRAPVSSSSPAPERGTGLWIDGSSKVCCSEGTSMVGGSSIYFFSSEWASTSSCVGVFLLHCSCISVACEIMELLDDYVTTRTSV